MANKIAASTEKFLCKCKSNSALLRAHPEAKESAGRKLARVNLIGELSQVLELLSIHGQKEDDVFL